MNIQKHEPHGIDINDKRSLRDLRSFVSIHGWRLKDVTKGAHNYNIRFNFHKCLELILNPTPPKSAQLHRTWALVHVKEYVWTIHALIPNTLTTPFDETMGVFRLLHALSKLISPLLLMIFILKQRLLYIERHLCLPWFIHHIFFPMAP